MHTLVDVVASTKASEDLALDILVLSVHFRCTVYVLIGRLGLRLAKPRMIPQ